MTAYTNSTRSGPPISGRYAVGDTVTDSNGIVWECVVGGQAGYPDESTARWTAQPARESVQMTVPIKGAKAGATAGWTVAAAADAALATLAAGQTNATLIIPIDGLNVGDVVTGVAPLGQIEGTSGNIAVLAMDVRKQTTVAADHTDVSIGTGNTGNITADTALSGTTGGNTSLSETIAAGETIYAKLTGTTATATDIAVSGLLVTLTRASGT